MGSSEPKAALSRSRAGGRYAVSILGGRLGGGGVRCAGLGLSRDPAATAGLDCGLSQAELSLCGLRAVGRGMVAC